MTDTTKLDELRWKFLAMADYEPGSSNWSFCARRWMEAVTDILAPQPESVAIDPGFVKVQKSKPSPSVAPVEGGEMPEAPIGQDFEPGTLEFDRDLRKRWAKLLEMDPAGYVGGVPAFVDLYSRCQELFPPPQPKSAGVGMSETDHEYPSFIVCRLLEMATLLRVRDFCVGDDDQLAENVLAAVRTQVEQSTQSGGRKMVKVREFITYMGLYYKLPFSGAKHNEGTQGALWQAALEELDAHERGER